MKKIFFALLLLLSVIPISSAAAERVSAIDGITPTNPYNSMIDFAKAFDGDPDTFASYTSGGWSPQYTWKLPEKVTIDAFILNGYLDDLRPYNAIDFNVIQEDGTSIKIAAIGYRSFQTFPVSSNDPTVHALKVPIPNVVAITLNISHSFTGVKYKLYEFQVYTTKLTENPEPEKFKINGLKSVLTSNDSITLQWDPIQSDYFKTYDVYQNNKLLGSTKGNSYSISGLEPGVENTFKVVPIDTFDKDYAPGVISYTLPIPDTTPPAIPKNLKAVADQTAARITWDAVPDSDLFGYYVYLNDKLLTSSPINRTYYDVTGLEVETEYTVEVSAVDISGNHSEKSEPLKFTTLSLATPPPKPMGLEANLYDGAVMLHWKSVPTAKSYIVYQDDKVVDETDKTSHKIDHLKNGVKYTYQISAVNDIGESEKSEKVTVIPSEAHLPFIALGYDLKDVSDGTSNWFGSFWLILAFVIAIGLSFWFGRNIKTLFGGGNK